MAEDELFADRRRASEEDYFRKKDRELVERMRKAALAEQARRDMSARTGLQDPELLRELEDLGFTPETVALLPLVPIVEVAWAEGGVTPAERTLLEQFARARGIEAGSPADAQLSAWLATKPSAGTFTRARRLIRAMLETGGAPAGGDLSADDVIRYCEQIASASGGILGIRRVSAEEHALLERIAAELKDRKK